LRVLRRAHGVPKPRARCVTKSQRHRGARRRLRARRAVARGDGGVSPRRALREDQRLTQGDARGERGDRALKAGRHAARHYHRLLTNVRAQNSTVAPEDARCMVVPVLRARRKDPLAQGRPRAALWLGLTLSLAGCHTDLCEERTTWASRDTAACVTCERECRSMLSEAPPSGCDEEFACVARCPDRSALTCGCSRGCLRTSPCLAAWERLFECYVDRCRAACR
jgi:hypothetical protein